MNKIAHLIINEIGDLTRLYIRARFIKGAGARLISTGLFILMVSAGVNFAGKLNVNISGLAFAGSMSSAETPSYFNYLALFLIVIGAFWILFTDHKQRKQEAIENNRKIAFVVQIDAYSNVIPTPLKSSLPTEIKGKPISIVIEKRDALVGGYNLQDVADDIINIERTLKQHAGGLDLADVSVCAGGLAPVPFLFLLGNVLEDERPIHWAEWDRKESRWAWANDGQFIHSWGLPTAEILISDEVVLKSGITYPISENEISTAFPHFPVVKWEPADKLFQRILDESSCSEICDEFKSLMLQLKGQGVKRVHFLLACSAALTMKLGSVLDPRNMPEVIVYQYEKNSDLIYTWGLGVKVHEGKKSAMIIDRRNRPSYEIVNL